MSDLGELAKALAKAQAEMQHAGKDAENPAFKKDGKGTPYATLASVINACRPALNKHGIAIVQLVCGDSADCATVETMLLHESGQSISARYSMPVAKKDPQGHGSAITYARRYALLAIVGLAADDDDGNDASRKPEPKREQAPAQKPAQPDDFRAIQVTWGPDKGKTIGHASDAGLEAWAARIKQAIDDPDNNMPAQERARAANTLDAVRRELVSR